MSRSVKITRSGTELRGGGRAAAGQIVHMLDAEADVLVDRGEATELNTISQAIMPTPANGDVLTYVTSDGRWENKPAAGGSDPNPTFASLRVTGASTMRGALGFAGYYGPDDTSVGLLTAYQNGLAVLASNEFPEFPLSGKMTIFTNSAGHSADLQFYPLATQGDLSSVDLANGTDLSFFTDGNGFGGLAAFYLETFDSANNDVILLMHKGKIGIGPFFLTEPQATLHVDGTLLIAGNVGFNGASPSHPTLATGAGATVDQVIGALQTLGLVKQS